jgi:hypothetical protein
MHTEFPISADHHAGTGFPWGILIVTGLAAAIAFAGCWLWQVHDAQAEPARHVAFERQQIDATIAHLKRGEASDPAPYVPRPAPLPARQPLLSALVAGVAVLAIGRVLVVMRD